MSLNNPPPDLRFSAGRRTIPEKQVSPKVFRVALITSFAIGLILRTIQFWGRSSLWFDELTNALNIQSRSFVQLVTKTLDYNQVAPPGFLVFEKIATLFLGNTDHAFRLFPFLFSLAAMPLFYAIAKRFLKDVYLLAAFFLFAVCGSQIFYGGEGKPYSGDVTISLFLVWCTFLLIEEKITTGKALAIGVGGAILIVSSLPAIPLAVLLLGLAAAAHYHQHLPTSRTGKFFIVFGWFIGCLVGYLYAINVISNTVQDAMTKYWSEGFAPMRGPLHVVGWVFGTVFTELNFFLTTWTKLSFPWIVCIAFVILLFAAPGLFFLGRKAFIPLLVLTAPFFLAVLLALTRTLPFTGRVSLYATWPFLVVGFAGLQYLAGTFARNIKPITWKAIAVAIPLPFVFILLFSAEERPPYHEQPSQLVLREVKKRMQPGDLLYVYFKARHAMHFYAGKENITEYQLSGAYNSAAPYLRELDKLKGKPRVWFFYTQWTRKQPYPDTMKVYLGTKIGKQIDVIKDPFGGIEDLEAAAYLYDLR